MNQSIGDLLGVLKESSGAENWSDESEQSQPYHQRHSRNDQVQHALQTQPHHQHRHFPFSVVLDFVQNSTIPCVSGYCVSLGGCIYISLLYRFIVVVIIIVLGRSIHFQAGSWHTHSAAVQPNQRAWTIQIRYGPSFSNNGPGPITWKLLSFLF